jgi:threonine/homoserine/homoserine lactone efflux protein
MQSLIGIFFGSFAIALSGALMPGPMFVVVLGQSPRRGFWTGPVAVLGHGVLEGLLVGAVIFGLAEVISAPAVVKVIALTGGVVLLYMGVDMLRSAGSLSLKDESSKGSKHGGIHPFWAGILTSLANPYWIIWWATIGLGYLLIARRTGAVGLAAFILGHFLADLIWYSLVSTLATGGKRWLTDSVYRGMIRVCAVILLGFAAIFGYYGVNGT